MKLLKYIFILTILIATQLHANLNSYVLYYYGIKVGIIEDLSDMEKGYLKVKPENFLAKTFIKFNKYLIVYAKENKPDFEDSYYLEDKSNMIGIVNDIKKSPSSFARKVGKYKYLEVKCDDKCYWKLIRKNKLKSEGSITFKNGEIFEMSDTVSHMDIKLE